MTMTASEQVHEVESRRLSHRIRRLVAELSEAPRLEASDLAAALAAPVSFDDVRAFVRFDADAYARVPVYRGERFELRLLCWRPGQCTSLHGHGAAACAFRVVRGAAEEIVLGARDRVWPPGAVVEETSPRVHQVRNAGPDPLITLHAYSPPLPIDAPSPRSGRRVVVVGGGLAGMAVAYHLLRLGDSELRIDVVERGPWLGRGVAYGVESDVFRLNVPAGGMSLDAEDPDGFARFAGEGQRAFVSRAAYGRYVAARLADAIATSPAKLRVYRDEAIAVGNDHVELRGERLLADAVVLATGLTLDARPWSPRIVDAWDECGLATLRRDARVLVVGSGLSALDVILWLDARRFIGEVTMISRRGLLPSPHVSGPSGAALTASEIDRAPTTLRPLIRWIRAHLERAEPWQHGVDALRPHVATLYARLGPEDRRRFLVHVRPYWDVVRHRAPADVLERTLMWERDGRLVRRMARIADTREDADGIDVALRDSKGGIAWSRFDAIVRCVGPAPGRDVSPLAHSLFERGLARPDASGIGVETDPRGRIVDASGRTSNEIYGVGWVRRASFWETTAAPDIVRDAYHLAQRLVGTSQHGSP